MAFIRHDIDGAPFHIGAYVEVTQILDPDTVVSGAEVGDVGWVEHYEYECGCGQTYPHDPMIGVLTTRGVREEFWEEELKELPRPVRDLP